MMQPITTLLGLLTGMAEPAMAQEPIVQPQQQSQKAFDFYRKVYGMPELNQQVSEITNDSFSNFMQRAKYNGAIRDFAKNNPLVPGQFLDTLDFAEINPAYATDKNYAKGIFKGEELINKLVPGTPEYDVAQTVIQTANKQGQNPRLLLASVLHETSGFKKYPGNNPGGVKPSMVINEFIKSNPEVRNSLTQLQSTREQLFDKTQSIDINKLKDMFSDPRVKFETNYPLDKTGKVQGDIVQLPSKTLEDVNSLLKTAQTENTSESWEVLLKKLKTIQQLNPKKPNFWISQPFMKYETKEAGLIDMVRAQKGGRDTSILTKNPDGTIERIMPNGTKIIYGKK